MTVPLSEEKVAQANAAFPERPVEASKAWNEMIHRYFAGTLGLCVLAIAIIAVKQRKTGVPVRLPLLLLGLIIFQAALGMWTVTLNLLPVVVMGHLLGGFSVLSCLFILYLRLRNTAYKLPKNNDTPSASEMHDNAIGDLPQAKVYWFSCACNANRAGWMDFCKLCCAGLYRNASLREWLAGKNRYRRRI